MEIKNFLDLLEGVHGRDGQWTAKCPAHDDKAPSLSIAECDDGKILVHCHAGCNVRDIVSSMGLTLRDLFPPMDKPYIYNGGAIRKVRDPGKKLYWQHHVGNDNWEQGRNGITPELYIRSYVDFDKADTVFVVEGEKDVETMARLGYCACTGADGAGPGKWKPQYTERLKGRRVVILGDNDEVGMAYTKEIAAALFPVCTEVSILDLKKVWADIPEHGDVTDLVARFGDDEAVRKLYDLEIRTPKLTLADVDSSFKSILKALPKLKDFKKQEAKWLVPEWIPENQVTVLASDGGVGKTSLWVNIAAAISRGGRCILDPPDIFRQPRKVLFVSAEDSVSVVLLEKMEKADANQDNIHTIDQKENPEFFRSFKLGSQEMEKVIAVLNPALVILDPLQAFLPPTVNMGSRNQMRDCMAPLVAIGEKYGTTFLIIAHSNKRKGAAGRDRLADSADLWDIARSVMMGGFTQDEGIRYISNEKNNYGPLAETILFSFDEEGRVKREGTTWKRDRDFISDFGESTGKPRLEECKDFIISTLKEAGGRMPSKDLETELRNAGHKERTAKKAKKELKDEWVIRYERVGKDDCQLWYTVLQELEESDNS